MVLANNNKNETQKSTFRTSNTRTNECVTKNGWSIVARIWIFPRLEFWSVARARDRAQLHLCVAHVFEWAVWCCVAWPMPFTDAHCCCADAGFKMRPMFVQLVNNSDQNETKKKNRNEKNWTSHCRDMDTYYESAFIAIYDRLDLLGRSTIAYTHTHSIGCMHWLIIVMFNVSILCSTGCCMCDCRVHVCDCNRHDSERRSGATIS